MSKAILDLPKRPAVVTHINTRLEKHGDDNVLCADIKLEGIFLEPDELNLLLGDKHAHDALFVKPNGKGKAAEPMFRQLADFKLIEKFKDCAATIYHGLADDNTEFEDVNVTNVVLAPQVGGQTMMTCTVQTEIEDTSDVAALLEVLQSPGAVALLFGAKQVPEGKKAQGKLDLGAGTPPKGEGNTEGAPAEQVH